MAKDRPLLLRVRADGRTYLDSEDFPPRHEFSKEWLLLHTSNNEATVDNEFIELNLANGNAVYRITDEPSSGYWGELVEQDTWQEEVQVQRKTAEEAEADG